MKVSLLLVSILFIFQANAFAQKRKKNKKLTETELPNLVTNLQQHLQILASDSLQGRRTGTIGEQLAANYIKNQYSSIGILPKGDNGSYFQTFDVNEGKQFENFSTFYINDVSLQPYKDYFPLNNSGNAEVNEIVSPILKDAHTTWFYDLKDELVKNESNPHFDITPILNQKIKEYIAKGATAILLYNSSAKLNDNLLFDKKANEIPEKIALVYITKDAFKKYIKSINEAVEIKLKIAINDKKRTGTNIIGYIDNKASTTIIIGAHYDHLGYGEDHNSLYNGEPKLIHNGADDNASGVAATIEMARLLKTSKFTNNNYLFINFSGEELGLYGSKYFIEHSTIDTSTINYMINMDMVGRLNDSTKAFTIGGFGTSPTWGEVITTTDKWSMLQPKLDSSGTGPSDHSSFYRKGIPVLFFFTGTHSDYHKPTDDYDKINYTGEDILIKYILSIIGKTDSKPKLTFAKTKETAMGGSKTRFTVSLGIMPDYTYSGSGVKVDGVSDGKLAQKLGLQTGDIVLKLGDNTVTGVENYMKALGTFKKGDATKLVTQRKDKIIQYDIVF